MGTGAVYIFLEKIIWARGDSNSGPHDFSHWRSEQKSLTNISVVRTSQAMLRAPMNVSVSPESCQKPLDCLAILTFKTVYKICVAIV